MSVRVALGPRPPLALGERLLGTVAVVWARRLVRHRSVDEIRVRLDEILDLRSRPATAAQARRADEVVCAVRLGYLTQREATERAVAAALLCALRGTRVRWCWGVRTPPLETTAWIEAGGSAFGVAFDVAEAFTPLVTTTEAGR